MTDLRIPIGYFFGLLGLILLGVGLAMHPVAPLTTDPVDLQVGAAMIVFAGVMLWLGRRK